LNLIVIDTGARSKDIKDTLTTPVKQYAKKINGILVNVTEYKDTYGNASTSTGLMEYRFDSLKETGDSLIFFNAERIYGAKIFFSYSVFC